MPDFKKLVRERLGPMRLTGPAELDLAEELAHHLDELYRETLSGGAGEDQAYCKALAELDNMYPLDITVRRSERMPKHDSVPVGDVRGGNVLQDLWRDLRYAVRTMRKSPVFVVFVLLTLALGIGANTTVFTLINTLVLNALPVPDATSLAALGLSKEQSGSNAALPISYADLKDYQSRNETFASLAGYTSSRLVTWKTQGGSRQIFAELTTGNYFSTLGLSPARGRFFLPEEDASPGAHAVAVMNYATWQTHFGGTDDIIGKTLRLNNVVFTVIGVAPPHFIGVNAIFGPDLWIPATMAERVLPTEMASCLTDRAKTVFLGVGHLKPGVTRDQAQANMANIAASLARQFPAADQGQTATVRSVRDVLFGSGMAGSSQILFASASLLVVVGIVLLIACSNVANLLLARSAARQQEMAVRLAMGASRRRLVRQLLTESVLLGLLAGACGLVIAEGGLRLLFGMLPAAANFPSPRLDATVFGFALVVSLATGFLFGAIPALRASRSEVSSALKEESHTTGRSRSKVTIANALLVGQVAFSFLLLMTAALFLRGMQRAYEADPGFQTAYLAVFMTNPGQAGYSKPQTRAFYKEVGERMSRLPGVASASWASNLPLWARLENGLQVEGWQPRSQSDRITTVVNTVDNGYFETAGVTINRGREFSHQDQENSAAVAIVNEKMARDYWPDGEALGKRIRLPRESGYRVVVGVARNANYTNWMETPQLCVYVPAEQNFSDAMVLYVRSQGDPRQILMPVQNEIHMAGPQIVLSIRTGSEIVDGGLFQARVGVTLLAVFGLLALGLASIGLYGIMAYAVNQRKREIGLRMALGAARSSVLRLILKQGMSLVLTGVLLGLAGALLVGRLVSRMLYGVSASDPLSIAGAGVVLLGVALLACYVPARWASRVDPMVALREG